MLSYPMICRFSIGAEVQEIKNCYLPGMQTYTTKSAACIHITATKRQERGIPGMKLLPILQLIKRLEGRPYFKPPGSPSPRVIVGYCGGPFLFLCVKYGVLVSCVEYRELTHRNPYEATSSSSSTHWKPRTCLFYCCSHSCRAYSQH